MLNNNFENVYRAFNCFSEAKKFTESAINNILEATNILDKYYITVPLILSKTSELNLTNFKINNMIKNGLIIYEVSQIIISTANKFSKDAILIDKILENGSNAINKIYEGAEILSNIGSNVIDNFIAVNEEQVSLIEIQTPNSTSIIDNYELSGQLELKLIEVY